MHGRHSGCRCTCHEHEDAGGYGHHEGGHHHDCCCEGRGHSHHRHHCCGEHGHHHGGSVHEHGFHRRFATRAERLARMEEYLQDLQAEIKAVEEQIAELKAAL